MAGRQRCDPLAPHVSPVGREETPEPSGDVGDDAAYGFVGRLGIGVGVLACGWVDAVLILGLAGLLDRWLSAPRPDEVEPWLVVGTQDAFAVVVEPLGAVPGALGIQPSAVSVGGALRRRSGSIAGEEELAALP